MTDIILHHYETSPYWEKVRLGISPAQSRRQPVVAQRLGRRIYLAIPDNGWKSARSEEIGRIVTYPTNRYLSNNKRN
jgi:hypothetical protein